MALNIKDPATDALARELAAQTGESITVALRVALQERLVRVRRQSTVSQRSSTLQRYIDRGRRRAVLDDRSAEEIIGYDEHGIPA